MITDKNKEFLASFGTEKHVDELMNDEDSDMMSDIAKNPNLQPHHIDRLIADPYVRNLITDHPNLQPHHIDKLVKDSSWLVRASISRHSNLQSHHIEKLSRDEDSAVRNALSRNPRYQDYLKDKK